jgi:hypothetical protein
MPVIHGRIHKMHTHHGETIEYKLDFAEPIILNELLGKFISLSWTGIIECVSCGKVTKKSFNQGFCYNCFMKAPESAECIIRPELCRAHLGEGRDVDWETNNHNQPHVVYLAASDVVKVGVTRSTQIPTRWIDQGATSAIRLAETPNRYLAGMIEVALKEHFTDRTNWQRMLRNEQDDTIDLIEEKWRLEEVLPADMVAYFTEDDTVLHFQYPVSAYPAKVKSVTFDKEKLIAGTLVGIKGQYLIFDNDAVLNLRKHTGYMLEVTF